MKSLCSSRVCASCHAGSMAAAFSTAQPAQPPPSHQPPLMSQQQQQPPSMTQQHLPMMTHQPRPPLLTERQLMLSQMPALMTQHQPRPPSLPPPVMMTNQSTGSAMSQPAVPKEEPSKPSAQMEADFHALLEETGVSLLSSKPHAAACIGVEFMTSFCASRDACHHTAAPVVRLAYQSHTLRMS